MPKKRFVFGVIDPITIIGVLFLIITLSVGTYVVADKKYNFNIFERAGKWDSLPDEDTNPDPPSKGGNKGNKPDKSFDWGNDYITEDEEVFIEKTQGDPFNQLNNNPPPPPPPQEPEPEAPTTEPAPPPQPAPQQTGGSCTQLCLENATPDECGCGGKIPAGIILPPSGRTGSNASTYNDGIIGNDYVNTPNDPASQPIPKDNSALSTIGLSGNSGQGILLFELKKKKDECTSGGGLWLGDECGTIEQKVETVDLSRFSEEDVTNIVTDYKDSSGNIIATDVLRDVDIQTNLLQGRGQQVLYTTIKDQDGQIISSNMSPLIKQNIKTVEKVDDGFIRDFTTIVRNQNTNEILNAITQSIHTKDLAQNVQVENTAQAYVPLYQQRGYSSLEDCLEDNPGLAGRRCSVNVANPSYTAPLYNFGTCNREELTADQTLSCNKQLSALFNLPVVGDMFSYFTDSYAPQNMQYTGEEFLGIRNYIVTEDQAKSSIKLGTFITSVGTFLGAAPEILAARSLGLTFDTYMATNTASSILNSVGTCTDGVTASCVEATAQAFINLLFAGSIDKLKLAVEAKNVTQAISATRTLQGATILQAGVNIENTIEACNPETGTFWGCSANLAGDALLAFGIVQNNQLLRKFNTIDEYLTQKATQTASQNTNQNNVLDVIWDPVQNKFVTPENLTPPPNTTALAVANQADDMAMTLLPARTSQLDLTPDGLAFLNSNTYGRSGNVLYDSEGSANRTIGPAWVNNSAGWLADNIVLPLANRIFWNSNFVTPPPLTQIIDDIASNLPTPLTTRIGDWVDRTIGNNSIINRLIGRPEDINLRPNSNYITDYNSEIRAIEGIDDGQVKQLQDYRDSEIAKANTNKPIDDSGEIMKLIEKTKGPVIEVGGPSGSFRQIDVTNLNKKVIVTNIQDGKPVYDQFLDTDDIQELLIGHVGKVDRILNAESMDLADQTVGSLIGQSLPASIMPKFSEEAFRVLEKGGVLALDNMSLKSIGLFEDVGFKAVSISNNIDGSINFTLQKSKNLGFFSPSAGVWDGVKNWWDESILNWKNWSSPFGGGSPAGDIIVDNTKTIDTTIYSGPDLQIITRSETNQLTPTDLDEIIAQAEAGGIRINRDGDFISAGFDLDGGYSLTIPHDSDPLSKLHELLHLEQDMNALQSGIPMSQLENIPPYNRALYEIQASAETLKYMDLWEIDDPLARVQEEINIEESTKVLSELGEEVPDRITEPWKSIPSNKNVEHLIPVNNDLPSNNLPLVSTTSDRIIGRFDNTNQNSPIFDQRVSRDAFQVTASVDHPRKIEITAVGDSPIEVNGTRLNKGSRTDISTTDTIKLSENTSLRWNGDANEPKFEVIVTEKKDILDKIFGKKTETNLMDVGNENTGNVFFSPGDKVFSPAINKTFTIPPQKVLNGKQVYYQIDGTYNGKLLASIPLQETNILPNTKTSYSIEFGTLDEKGNFIPLEFETPLSNAIWVNQYQQVLTHEIHGLLLINPNETLLQNIYRNFRRYSENIIDTAPISPSAGVLDGVKNWWDESILNWRNWGAGGSPAIDPDAIELPESRISRHFTKTPIENPRILLSKIEEYQKGVLNEFGLPHPNLRQTNPNLYYEQLMAVVEKYGIQIRSFDEIPEQFRNQAPNNSFYDDSWGTDSVYLKNPNSNDPEDLKKAVHEIQHALDYRFNDDKYPIEWKEYRAYMAEYNLDGIKNETDEELKRTLSFIFGDRSIAGSTRYYLNQEQITTMPWDKAISTSVDNSFNSFIVNDPITGTKKWTRDITPSIATDEYKEWLKSLNGTVKYGDPELERGIESFKLYEASSKELPLKSPNDTQEFEPVITGERVGLGASRNSILVTDHKNNVSWVMYGPTPTKTGGDGGSIQMIDPIIDDLSLPIEGLWEGAFRYYPIEDKLLIFPKGVLENMLGKYLGEMVNEFASLYYPPRWIGEIMVSLERNRVSGFGNDLHSGNIVLVVWDKYPQAEGLALPIIRFKSYLIGGKTIYLPGISWATTKILEMGIQ